MLGDGHCHDSRGDVLVAAGEVEAHADVGVACSHAFDLHTVGRRTVAVGMG
jgi:hypothetical protein